jgi:hypothetical protein
MKASQPMRKQERSGGSRRSNPSGRTLDIEGIRVAGFSGVSET